MEQPLTATEQATLARDFQAFAETHGLSVSRAGRVLAGDHKLSARIAAGSLTYRKGNELREAMRRFAETQGKSAQDEAAA
jgi:hypothetical protein